jgi:hypothetical protein
MNLVRLICMLGMLGAAIPGQCVEPWRMELASMPLNTNRIHFFKGEPARAILRAFTSNPVVKAIVMMPGSTDELYFHDRGTCFFTNNPTLLDALNELTNRTSIRATFRAPFLLLSETNDYSMPLLAPSNSETFEILAKKSFVPEWLMLDKEWDQLYPLMDKHLGLKLTPKLGSPEAWHFYRVYFSAYNLNAKEAIELISLAAQTEVHAEKNRLIFSLRPPAAVAK